VTEIIKMAEKGKPEQVERTAERLNNYLVMAANLAAPQGVQPEVMLAPPAPEPGPQRMMAPAPEAVPKEAPAPLLVDEAPEKEAGAVMAPAPPAAVEEAPIAPAEAEVAPESAKPDRRAKLRVIVARHAVEHQAALRAVLEKVPESAKPKSDAEYEKILRALRGRRGD